MPEILGEYIDRLITSKMTENPGKATTARPRGSFLKTYEFAREKQGAPLTFLAAKSIIDSVEKGDFVFVVTGAGAPPYMWVSETDGPPGAATIARALDVGFKAKPVMITSKEKMEALIACCNAAELAIQPEEWVRKRQYGAAIAEPLSLDDKEAEAESAKLVEKYHPAAMIFTEMTGINAKGVMHSMSATDRTPYVAKAHHLVNIAKERGIPTIGIGDGGNEIGFGMVRDRLKTLGGLYSDCSPCSCKDGVATVISTDVLISAAVSNWGVYGVEACLASMLGNMDVIHNETVERRVLEAGVDKGLASAFGRQKLDVDGTTLAANQALITILREMCKNFLHSYEKRAF